MGQPDLTCLVEDHPIKVHPFPQLFKREHSPGRSHRNDSGTSQLLTSLAANFLTHLAPACLPSIICSHIRTVRLVCLQIGEPPNQCYITHRK